MSPGKRPPLELDAGLIYCGVHRHKIETRGIAGDVKAYTLASNALLYAFLEEPEVVAYCGGVPERGIIGDVGRIPWAVRRFGPLCDRVSRETLEEILTDAAAGRHWRGIPR